MFLIQRFIDYLALEKKCSKHTVTAYLNDLQAFQKYISTEFNQEEISEVHYNQIRSWIVSLVTKKISNKTINRKISALKSFYKFLIKTKTIQESPLQKHKSLKTPKRINIPFNKNEINAVLNNLFFENDFESIRDSLIITLLYATGLRRNELISLKIHDIDLNQNQIKVLGKRNKERNIPLLKILKPAIIQYLKVRKELIVINDENFFLTKKGNKLYGTLVYRKINLYFSSVSTKVKKSPHILRHSFATHLLNEGADLIAVKELLGHASLASTQVYVNSSLKELKNVYNRSHPRGSKK